MFGTGDGLERKRNAKAKNGREHLSCTAMLLFSLYSTDQSGFQMRRARVSPSVLPVSFAVRAQP